MSDELISGFGSHAQQMQSAIDFSLARRIDRAGTTCDAYECNVQLRHLFIKRLKGEYRDNPVYRAAFEKEYELGVGLNHVSLPRYVGYGEDYITMDFIEGDTLAELIRRNDPRIKNKHFVKRLLRELIDVVEYLHNSHVVHCDIKPDNIIISPHSDRPLTLIDLDKAYTSWLETTHGNPEKYGCNDCTDGQIDFKGIGLIAGKFGMKRLARACKSNTASADTVRKTLKRGIQGIWVMIPLIVVAISITLALYLSKSSESPIEPEQSIPMKDSVKGETPILQSIAPDDYKLPVSNETEPTETPSVFDASWLGSLIKSKTEVLETEQRRVYDLLEKGEISGGEAFMAWTDYQNKSNAVRDEIYESAVLQYPKQKPAVVRLEVNSNEEWGKWTRQDDDLFFAMKKYTKEHTTQ